MTTVPPAPPPLPPQGGSPAPAPPAVTARAIDPPPAVTRLPQGAVLEATVTQAAVRGQPAVVAVPGLGLLAIRTPLPLPEGSQLTLELVSQTRGGALLRITAINGQPINQGTLPDGATVRTGGSAPQSGGLTTGVQAGAQASQSATDARGLISATVVRGSAGAGTLGPGLPTGTQIQARLLGLQPGPGQTGGAPGVGTFTSTAPAGPGQGSPSGAGQPSGAPAGSAAAGQTAAPGGNLAGSGTGPATANEASAQARTGQTTLFGRIGAALNLTGGSSATTGSLNPATGLGSAPAATGAAAPQTGAATTLTGTVQADGAASRTLLSTPSGTLALGLRLDAPPGSQVTLGIVSTTPPGPAAALGGLGATALSIPQGGAQGWPALTQAVAELSQSEPAAARALQQALPQPGANLAAALGALTAGLRAGGDIRQWPGQAPLTALEAAGTKGERLAETLRGDLRAMAGRTRESPGGEWRAITLPFSDGAEIAPITLITRVRGGRVRDDDGDDPDDRGRGADPGDRFLVDITLSALGRMQIDGLMRPKARQLHLILRTAEALPPTMCDDLQVIAETGLMALGLAGGLTFQPDGRFVEAIPADPDRMLGDAPPHGIFA